MRFFFKSRNFKILVMLLAGIILLTVVVTLVGKISSPLNVAIGAVTGPVQRAFTSVTDKIDGFNKTIGDNEDLMAEIDRLQKENESLKKQLTDYDQAVSKKDFYEEYLGIKDKNSDMLFQSAAVISRDFTDPYKSFTVDTGLLDGAALYDPVISSAGLIGYISEIAPTYSKVTTILNPLLKAGGENSRTRDNGVISGRTDLAENGFCCFYNLQRDSTASVGDIVITHGGSVFPAGLSVGSITDIKQQSKDNSLYAEIKSDVDFDALKDVMIITYFSGQGNPGGAK